MKLLPLSENLFYLPHEAERDRPLLGYVRGTRLALAVDAGYSAAHADAFAAALRAQNLPPPDLTLLTHWHLDHSLGLSHIHGLSLATKAACAALEALAVQARDPGWFAARRRDDPFFALEYREAASVPRVRAADIAFDGPLRLDLGGVAAEIFPLPSPHSADSAALFLPGESALFLGDAPSVDFSDPGQATEENLEALIAALQRFPPCTCLLSHCAPLPLSELQDYLRTEARQALKAR